LLGLFDKDVAEPMIFDYPQLYNTGHTNSYFNLKTFFGWMLNSIYHSLFAVLLAFFVYSTAVPDDTGKTVGLWYVGTIIYTCVVLLVTLKLALELRRWTMWHHLGIWGSLLAYAVWVLVWHSVGALHFFSLGDEVFLEIFHILPSPLFYLTVVLLVIGALLRDFTWKFFSRYHQPRPYHIVQEVEIEQRKSFSEITTRQKNSFFTGYGFSADQDAHLSQMLKRGHGKKHLS